jgi:hypothetical protein
MKCINCEEKTKKLHKDPNSPPLDHNECLCPDCWEGNASGMIEKLREQVQSIIDYARENKIDFQYAMCGCGLMDAGLVCTTCGSGSV